MSSAVHFMNTEQHHVAINPPTKLQTSLILTTAMTAPAFSRLSRTYRQCWFVRFQHSCSERWL